MSSAVDDAKTSMMKQRVKLSPSWSPGYVSTNEDVVMQQSFCQRRPEVIRNLPDKWGHRDPSPWSHDWFRYTTRPTSFETRNQPGKHSWFHPAGSMTVPHSALLYGGLGNRSYYQPTPALQLNVDNTARTRVLNEVGAKKWDLGVTAGELRETVLLGADLCKQVLSSARNLEKEFGQQIAREVARSRNMARRPTVYERRLLREGTRKARSQAAVYEAARNQWMQYNFGLRPLARDVHDATNALNNLIGAPIIVYGRAGASQSYKRRRTVTPSNCLWQFDEEVNGEFAVHYSVQYESGTDGVSSLTQLGLDNPWSVGYELARLSWLLDYAVGVGEWLSSWTALNGMKFRKGSITKIWRATSSLVQGSVKLEPSGNNPQIWVLKPKPSWALDAGRMERGVITAPLTPAFAPQIKNQLGMLQLANSLFVLSQFAGRR